MPMAGYSSTLDQDSQYFSGRSPGQNRDGLDVLVDDAALAEVFVNPYGGAKLVVA